MITAIDEAYLERCRTIGAASNCVNRKVGALVISNGRTVGTGYNYNPVPKGPLCAAGCPRAGLPPEKRTGDYDLCLYVHAEAAALIEAGEQADSGTLYCTDHPCPGCWKLIYTAVIWRVVWPGHDQFLDEL